MRKFETGATRDNDEEKIDFDGFLSPEAIRRYSEYMHKHRKQADGQLRNSDNWKKGIPQEAYMKSMWRHFFDVWEMHHGIKDGDIEEALCALYFNVQGMLHETINDSYRIIRALRDADGGRNICSGHTNVARSASDKQVPASILDRTPRLDGTETTEDSWEDEAPEHPENKSAPASGVNCSDSSLWGV